MANPNSYYSTPNTALAAYLLTEGFTFIDTGTKPKPHNQRGVDAVFRFQDDPHILDCVRLWHTGQAIGSLPTFYGNYRQFVRLAKKAVRMAEL